MRLRAIALLALVLAMTAAATQSARAAVVDTVPAAGTFSFSTANGILPTWSSEDIVIIGVSPGTVSTATANLTARISLPIVAKTGSANAAGGGFRLYNSRTGLGIRCSNPTIDTLARLVDCVLPTGKNAALFNIRSIGSRAHVLGESTITWIYRGMVLGINGQAMADVMNTALDTTVFSPYVNVGIGDLVVTRDR